MKKNNFAARLVNPNVGHPRFIDIDSTKGKQQSILTKIKRFLTRKRKKHKYEYETKLLFASNITSIQEFRDYIQNQISLTPLLEERNKPRKFLFKVRNLFKRKEKLHGEEEFYDKFDGKRAKAYRGKAIVATIIDVQNERQESLTSTEYLQDEYCSPIPYYAKKDIFEGLDTYYCVSINFSLPKEVVEFLKLRTFVMFDIHMGREQHNYHSIIITKQKWKDFTFIQISDTHVAERNDRIYGIVSKWKKTTKESIFGKVANKIKCFFKKDSEEKTPDPIKEDPSAIVEQTLEEQGEDEDASEEDVPLKKRLINPNNQLRKFIKIANHKVLNNKLDFIVLTGDLIDFVVKSRYSPYVEETKRLDYKKSNWKVFKDIILNLKPDREYEGVIDGEELLCPILTIVGNHDFRQNCYDFNWGGLYKKIGLKPFEAAALNELFSASPITALSKSEYALKHYIREINPSLDFSVQLGDLHFIFLNSGGDAFKNFRDLVTGHPSVTGLTDDQIIYLENLINMYDIKDSKSVLFIHGPPINIGKKQYLRKRFKNTFTSNIKRKLEDFKESVTRKLGIEKSSRIDTSYNVKFGTVSKNWDRLVDFCLNYTILTLSGHTHLSKEFRLKHPTETAKVFDAPPFFLRRIEIPAEIYYDGYSEIYTRTWEIKEKTPFVVQTPALGLASYKKPNVVGGYRLIKFKKGELHSFKVKYLHQNEKLGSLINI
jgi:hypothetical protein